MTTAETTAIAAEAGAAYASQLFEREHPDTQKAQYDKLRGQLKALYEAYHEQSPKMQALLRGLLERDKHSAGSWRDDIIDTHNAFVMRYLAPGAPIPPKRIADHMNVGADTIRCRVERTMDRLMLYAFGVDGLKP